MAKKSGLGKGLDALFLDNRGGPDGQSGPTILRIAEIEPNREQPRQQFDEAALEELADSIREHGVLQPLLVRPLEGGRYQLVAGERRWRASRMAGLVEVPVIVREMTDEQAGAIALIENLQREDLNAVEEAEGYQSLMQQFGWTQEEVARRVHKSRPAISNALRLLGLPDRYREEIREGRMSAGHARALLALPEERREAVADQIVQQGLSVREVEAIARRENAPKRAAKTGAPAPDHYFEEVAIALGTVLGRKVTIKGKKAGTLAIEFFDREDLQKLVNLLTERMG